jgi:two-component system, NtrC family, response regulator HydG
MGRMTCRVFVGDDDRDHAESMADLLELHGYEVAMAHSGEEALARLSSLDFDVALMDVKLPGIDGVEAFLEMRKAKPAAPVIMMTGFSVEQSLARAIAGGAAGVLHKPFAIGELLQAIERAQPGRAAAAPTA